MFDDRHNQHATPDDAPDSSTRLAFTVSHHTRTCNKLREVYMQTGETGMSLERNRLARIDRRLLAGLDRDESSRMVRVPVTAATWSTWKRYCDAAGISMGRAIAVLIEHELVNALGEGSHAGVAVLVDQAEEQLAARERQVAGREESVGDAEERLRGRTERLRRHEAELQILEQRIEIASNAILRSRQTGPKVGRNERCPCGSGLKHKHCHGLAGR